MCRHVAYLGPPLLLSALVTGAPHGLLRQSWQPRHQHHGTVNADGFGIGWYVDGDPLPVRYRRDRPIWTDPFVTDLGRSVRSGAVLAAVRSGTEGMPYGEGAVAPFTAGRYLFSHNGRVPDWQALGVALEPLRAVALEAPTDSALLWALVQQRLAQGDELIDALRNICAHAPDGSRLNVLATDGVHLAATAWGDTLWWHGAWRNGVVVASEPLDDDPGWREAPDRCLLTVAPAGVQVEPL